MSPLGHVIVSATAAGVVATLTEHPLVGMLCFLAGVFIDLDHFLEYFWYEGVRLDVRDFKLACDETRFPRVLLILHSWEMLLLLWLLPLAGLAHPLLLGLLVGLTLHMICDQICNQPFPLAYFLTYRIGVRLDTTRIFRPAATLHPAMVHRLQPTRQLGTTAA